MAMRNIFHDMLSRKRLYLDQEGMMAGDLALEASKRVVLVTNIPAPYRNPVYKTISEKLGLDYFHVVFCAKQEANRDWVIEQQGFSYTFLKAQVIHKKGKYIHNNPDVWGVLNRLKPDVVITSGFNPTHLYAFMWACLNRKTHIPMTDGTLESEESLSFLHCLVRRIIYRFSGAFIGASVGSRRLYGSYGIPVERFFQSHLCANNEAFYPCVSVSRTYDFMFCGRFSSEKNPSFALDVAIGVARSLGRHVKLLFVGSGAMLDAVKDYAYCHSDELEATFKGFVQQNDLPKLYCDSKIFLFPTSWDPWGVVANEACAAGQAVIVSPHAGVVNELVLHNDNGYVLPLELTLWVEHATNLLSNSVLLKQFSEQSLQRVQNFSYAAAARGVIDAVEFATSNSKHNLAVISNNVEINKKKSVVIIQRRLCDYRAPLFERLKVLLSQNGIELRLLYGNATAQEQTKRDTVDIAWGEKLATRYLWGNRICWQPYSSKVHDADLVIVTQENKLVSNLWPLFGWRKYKLAFWGHGKNMQVLPTFKGRSKEQMKFLTTNRVDWWFLYTNVNLKHVVELGFSAEKMTNLENSIDTTTLKAQCEAVTSAEIAAIRSALDLGNGPVGLYVGSLYKDKRLDFLLSAGQLLSQKIPDFRLIVLGDGPQSALINSALAERPWLRFVGRQVGQQKARYLKTASVLLNPGLLGLSILDGFAAGVPIVTTDCGLHSPEIDYLQQGVNGFMTANTLDDYVQTVERILTDNALAAHLQKGCLEAAKHYTIENMAENFRAGILKALG